MPYEADLPLPVQQYLLDLDLRVRAGILDKLAEIEEKGYRVLPLNQLPDSDLVWTIAVSRFKNDEGTPDEISFAIVFAIDGSFVRVAKVVSMAAFLAN